MRIVAGKFRSRVIEAVDGDATRPTVDKVKEAVFSRIGPYFVGGEFDLVYLDPPYQKQQIDWILTYLEEHDLLSSGADVVCESLKEDSFKEYYGTLEQVKDATYGITRITYYKKR